MAYDSFKLTTELNAWLQNLLTKQWLDAAQIAPLLDMIQPSPALLDIQATTRPLLVAFMGGTGVGKSSLLNRLAGQAIAKAGIERPTSREITLYHHQSLTVETLGENLPLQKIKIHQHQDAQKKNLIWLDMPDFDSTEQANRQLVLQWLPHIDVLIYVVSPERYRDHKAWKILISEGGKHGWLFVLNQWDTGNIAQYEDFIAQLHTAGFKNPLVFRTCCTQANTADEFALLLNNLAVMGTEHTIQQFISQQENIKKQQLKQQLCYCKNLLAPALGFENLLATWQKEWQQTKSVLEQGFLWKLQQYAVSYTHPQIELNHKPPHLAIWDDWAQHRLNDALDTLILTAEQLQLAAHPLKHALYSVRETFGKNLEQHLEFQCRTALLKPGNPLQRGCLKIASVCNVLLPLLALSGVSYQVVTGYYQSYLHQQAYLNVDFIAHSSLLILLSGLIPYFIQKHSQPSLEKTALRGLKQGLNLALHEIEMQVNHTILSQQQQQQQLLNQLNQYIAECETCSISEMPPHSLLHRVLPE